MPGLRITFDRRWPAIFEKHPQPWRMDTTTATGPAVIDAAGSVVVEGDAHLTYWLYDLYEYLLYTFRDYVAAANCQYWTPIVVSYHPLPWWWHRHLEYDGGPAEEEHTVFDAEGVRVFDCMGDDPNILAYAALYALAVFVECRIRTREVVEAQ